MDEKIKIHMIGNAHIDPVWLWRWQEGFAEIKATFRSALDRMNEFPEFVFTSACASYYKWIEENCPGMFEEIKERVREGRWVVVGGWWLQPDCNIPAGESFVRHGLYSQRYFKDKFGVMSKVGYNVDSFGHNGMLPQILKKSGMDYYVFMRPGDAEKELPNVFWWESEDGSRVMTYKIPFSYNLWWEDSDNPLKDKILEVKKMAQDQGQSLMVFYGVGNHGGGPTVANIKLIKELNKGDQGNILFSSPLKYFEEMDTMGGSLPIIKGDLQHHASGCYSANSKVKAANRKSENRLLAAEKFASLAKCILCSNYSVAEIRLAWEKVLFNQFHDILAGCSIQKAYDDAFEFYGKALTVAAEIQNNSLQKISWSIDTTKGGPISEGKGDIRYLWDDGERGVPLVVFNPLSWDVEAQVQVNKQISCVTDDDGNELLIQRVRGSFTNRDYKMDTIFMGRIPALGYRVYWLYSNSDLPQTESSVWALDAGVLENRYIKVEFEKHTGYIKSIFSKDDCMEFLNGKGAVPIVIDEYDSDTWAHGIFEFRNETGRFTDAKISVLEDGPVRAVIRVENYYNDSSLRQDFILYSGSADIKVHVRLDWREKHKMLKLVYPVNVQEYVVTSEIPYGFIQRAADGKEYPGQQWLDVSGTTDSCEDETFGLAILNDSKYSFDVKDNEIRMTLVRSPLYADHFGIRDDLGEFMDQGIHEFTYSIVPHKGDWKEGAVVRKAYELNVPVEQIFETYHKGSLPKSLKGIEISPGNIVAVVFKRAEDDNGFILRCYETEGRETKTSIELTMLDRKWEVDFGRCEIKTFFIPDALSEDVEETNLLEHDMI